MTEYGLGRLPEFDQRSRMFSAVSQLSLLAEPRTKTWRRGGAYDQGQTPHCVAYAGKGILNTAPLSSLVDYDIRSEYQTQFMYDGAQRLDQWEGENYEGTSALGLGKFLLSINLINSYHWCFGLNDVLLALSYEGPVGIGVWWYEGMFFPNEYGFIYPTGGLAGGHEVELIGVNVEHRYVIGMNSWGTGWGDRGRFYIEYEELEQLLDNDGDAVVFR